MIDERNLTKYYQSIAEKLDEIVPVEWDEIVMYGEELGDVRTACLYYKQKGKDEYRSGGLIPSDYCVDADVYAELIYELMHINKKLWKEFLDADVSTWEAFTFHLSPDYHFKIKFGYKINREISDYEREIIWAYNELGAIPKDVFSKKILEEYLAEKN